MLNPLEPDRAYRRDAFICTGGRIAPKGAMRYPVQIPRRKKALVGFFAFPFARRYRWQTHVQDSPFCRYRYTCKFSAKTVGKKHFLWSNGEEISMDNTQIGKRTAIVAVGMENTTVLGIKLVHFRGDTVHAVHHVHHDVDIVDNMTKRKWHIDWDQLVGLLSFRLIDEISEVVGIFPLISSPISFK